MTAVAISLAPVGAAGVVMNLAPVEGAGAALTLAPPLAAPVALQMAPIAAFAMPTSAVIYGELFGIWPNADGVQTAQGFAAALAYVAANGPRILQLPAGQINIDAPPAWQVGTHEGTAIKLTAAHSGITIRGAPNATVIVPASNRIEIIANLGASDVSIIDVKFDNSVNGLLQHNNPPSPIVPNGGVAGLGNWANCAIRQYTGPGLALIGVTINGFNTSFEYFGYQPDNTVLAGDLYLEDYESNNCCYGLIHKPANFMAFNLRGSGMTPNLHSNGFTDGPHLIYLTDRSGASPNTVVISNVRDKDSLAQTLKIRNGTKVAIGNVVCDNCYGGVLIDGIQGPVVTNVSVKMMSALPMAVNYGSGAIVVLDCANANVSHCVIDMTGVPTNTAGIFVQPSLLVTDPSYKSWMNSGNSLYDNNIISDGNPVGTAPIRCDNQTFLKISKVSGQNTSSTLAANRAFIDLYGCVNVYLFRPSYFSTQSDDHALVRLSIGTTGIACSNIWLEYRRSMDLTTSSASAAMLNPDATAANYFEIDLDGALNPTAINMSGANPKLTAMTSGASLHYEADQTHIFTSGASLTEWMRVANGQVSIGGAPNAEAVRVINVGALVNRIEARGGATGGFVSLTAAGSDANPRFKFLGKGAGGLQFGAASDYLSFYGVTPVAKPTVSGSCGGNAALASLINALATLGLLTNSTTS